MIQNSEMFLDPDGSLKCVYNNNGRFIEMTLLNNRPDKDVICVPTHYFCNLGCKMCHLTGLGNNIHSVPIQYDDFIFAMVLTLCHQNANSILKGVSASYDLIAGDRRTNKKKLLISFMGVGDPILNTELIKKVWENSDYIKRFLGYDDIGLALSTMMPSENFYDFTDTVNELSIPLKIHFSLHSPIDEKRREIIPASKLSVQTCMKLLKRYKDTIKKNSNIMTIHNKLHRTDEIVEIHYTLIKDVNDNKKDLEMLCSLIKTYGFAVKFIKFNEKDNLKASEKEESWKNALLKCGAKVKIYTPPGCMIGSSCGQFTKHYYHVNQETPEELEEFTKWRETYLFTEE